MKLICKNISKKITKNIRLGAVASVPIRVIPLTPYDLTGITPIYTATEIYNWLVAQNAANLSSQVLTITGHAAPPQEADTVIEALGKRFVTIKQ